MTLTEGVTLQVDDVYVPLGLVERKKPPKRKDQDDISPEQGSELYKEIEITKTFEHDAFLEEVLKQKNTPKSQGRRITIIGEPGAGKTTLLQQIANWVYCEIPQSVVVWVSLADLQGQKLEEYLLETWLTAAIRKKGKAKPTQRQEDDFVALFNQKNVWLLLDGLDEMSASNPLEEIARQLGEVGFITQARIVLTCRVNLWDGNTHKLDNFDIYRTLDFSYPEQVEQFIAKWFTKIEIPETGKQLCTALKKQGKERIQDLVKNPLRLTLLCLNWQSGDGKLPDTQAGLYQQFVDDFNKWKQEEFATSSRQRQQLNIKLGKLAKEAIDKESTRFRLRQDFVTEFLGDADDESSLLKLALNRGWLNQVGIDTNRKPVYAFFHASFQEYFAATAIDNWDFFLKHVPKNPRDGTYRIFEPQWKQTILLWLGREEEDLKQQKQEFIDALVSFKDGCKQFYEYRAYFLAAVGIAEFRDYSRAYEIVLEIAIWSFTREQKIVDEAWSALQQTDRTKAIIAFFGLLLKVSNFSLRQAIEGLRKVGAGNKDVIYFLVQLLQSKDVDDYTRSVAASSLGEIDPGNKNAIAALVQLLLSQDVNAFTFCLAAESLGKIGTGNKDAIAALVQLLQSKNVDRFICWQAEESLKENEPANKIEFDLWMLMAITKNVDRFIRWQAAESLRKIDPGNQDAIAALVQLLQSYDVNDNTGTLARQAAESLRKIDPGNKDAIAALVQLLQSQDVDDFIRWQAAESLGKIDPGNKDAIAALVQLLQSNDVDDFIRGQAAQSLEQIGIDNKNVIAALVQLLQSTTVDDYTRRQAAESLGNIDPGNQQAIAALVQLLQSNDVDDYTLWRVALSLGEINPGNENAIAALVRLLQSKDVDNFIRWRAAQSLGKIGTDNENAIAALVELLQSTTVDEDTRRKAASSLGIIIQNNQHRIEVVKALSGYWQLHNDYYDLAWKCAQDMPYPHFYQAWHQHNFATRTMRSLKKILFTRRL